MDHNPPNSSGPPIVKIVAGVILMVVGMALNQRIGILEPAGIRIEPGITIATIGVFLILFPVIEFFYIKPLDSAVYARNHELERTFGEAESLRAEMGQLRSDYEARLAATEAQAREAIQAQIREAQSLRQSLMSDAQSRADALVANAQAEVVAERKRLLSELRDSVTDLALTAAERIVGENMDTERNRRLVDEFITNSKMGAMAVPGPTPAPHAAPRPAGENA